MAILGIGLFMPWIITKNSSGIAFNEETAHIAETFGGIYGSVVGLVAVYLTFIAFWVQYKANVEQRKIIDSQANEKGLLSMLNLLEKCVDKFVFEPTKYSKEADLNEFCLHITNVNNTIISKMNTLQTPLGYNQ